MTCVVSFRTRWHSAAGPLRSRCISFAGNWWYTLVLEVPRDVRGEKTRDDRTRLLDETPSKFMLTAASSSTKCVPFARGDRWRRRHVLTDRCRSSVRHCGSWRDVLHDRCWCCVPNWRKRDVLNDMCRCSNHCRRRRDVLHDRYRCSVHCWRRHNVNHNGCRRCVLNDMCRCSVQCRRRRAGAMYSSTGVSNVRRCLCDVPTTGAGEEWCARLNAWRKCNVRRCGSWYDDQLFNAYILADGWPQRQPHQTMTLRSTIWRFGHLVYGWAPRLIGNPTGSMNVTRCKASLPPNNKLNMAGRLGRQTNQN